MDVIAMLPSVVETLALMPGERIAIGQSSRNIHHRGFKYWVTLPFEQDQSIDSVRRIEAGEEGSPHMLKHIFLHLARSPEFPEGSAERGYELVAPLNASNHLDVDEWKSHKAKCHVRRFWPGE